MTTYQDLEVVRGKEDFIDLDQEEILHQPRHLVRGLILLLIATLANLLLLLGLIDQKAIEGLMM